MERRWSEKGGKEWRKEGRERGREGDVITNQWSVTERVWLGVIIVIIIIIIYVRFL